ncbi:MAG: replicative DNA helicase [Limisphaerales bacterium]
MSSDGIRTPHHAEAEAATIGCALMDATLAGELRESWFFDARHTAIASAILDLAGRSEPVTEATVRQRAGNHLAETIGHCLDVAPSPAGWDYWRGMAEDFAKLRRAWTTLSTRRVDIENLPTTASPEDVRNLLDAIERDVLDVRSEDKDGHESNASEAVDALFDRLEAGERPVSVATGLASVDRILRMRPGQFVVVAARPSQGKTALALRVTEHVALRERMPVGFISLEMSTPELMQRMASGLSGVPYQDFENPNEDQQPKIINALGTIKRAPIRFYDRGGTTLPQITSVARRWKSRHGVSLLVVDYLQLIRGDPKHRSRYESVTEVSNGLKRLARDLDVVILCLAQLNRQAADDEQPRLHHLRDSGSIEQDADAVALLHVTDYDGCRRNVSLLLEKQRNGPLGEAKLTLHGLSMRFESVSPVDPEDYPP